MGLQAVGLQAVELQAVELEAGGLPEGPLLLRMSGLELTPQRPTR
jgi:hypothetical protein